MPIDQLVLQLEDKSEQVHVWKDLPPDSRMHVARIYARLCIRAAKVVTSMTEQKESIEPCKLKR
jgi:hypothetical protein